ncbi:hypothetical protein IE4771_PE00603 (plasmid) [Rhizobium etli bv. mimosae str. IE4771]|uniref:Uncharacterized protein n=1 Tax=Rhizobium etli bv. mimosae str. IE4771 TaxID=1432050 RepID=A0A060IJS6_RHIET|nr:hypothetical protein IE4771_PE00603 [Rhizobium sp. IE4771]ARQ62565.1 hypothetical protein Kim5_PD00561 [Rhizobium sp. Kim5]
MTRCWSLQRAAMPSAKDVRSLPRIGSGRNSWRRSAAAKHRPCSCSESEVIRNFRSAFLRSLSECKAPKEMSAGFTTADIGGFCKTT